MERTRLGRTDLQVSRMGVGAGGASRIGHGTIDAAESVALLRRAFDAGVNIVDTAEVYGTEEIIGQALREHGRDGIVVSSKKSTRHEEVTAETLHAGLDASLDRLGIDTIDVYLLHGVIPEKYPRLVEEVYPALQAAQEAGKIRFVGLSEMYNEDLDHTMARMALADDLWDVLMIGFSLLNQTARAAVFEATQNQDVGVQVMFAVRKALSSVDNLRQFIAALIASGEIDADDVDVDDPLGFIGDPALSVPDVAYRFSRDEPGAHVILSGTGNAQHLEANLASFERPPLPPAVTEQLRHIFRNVHSSTGQKLPD